MRHTQSPVTVHYLQYFQRSFSADAYFYISGAAAAARLIFAAATEFAAATAAATVAVATAAMLLHCNIATAAAHF